MNSLSFLCWFLAIFCGLLRPGFGQLEVDVKLDSDAYMKYEPIMVHVKVSNFAGHTIGLFNHDGKPWLSFFISRQNGEQVDEMGAEYDLQQAQVAGGDTLTIHVNLTPVYNIRASGIYRVMAIVYSASYNRQFKSEVKQFDLRPGRVIWTETVAIIPSNAPPSQTTFSTNDIGLTPPKENLRTYVLVANRVGRSEKLYARVEDEAKNIVYAVIPLGVLVGFGQPETKVDKQSHLHVLHQVGSRSFAYDEIMPDGKNAGQKIFSNLKSRPELNADTIGKVTVAGGEQVYPNPSVLPVPLNESTSIDTPPAKK
jgi:hypothetical protein